MVDQDELERRLLTVLGLGGGGSGPYHHSVLDGQRASRLELRHALDLDETHATRTDRWPEARLVAEHGNLDARRQRRFDDARALRNLDSAVVDVERDEIRRSCLAHACAAS